MPAKVSSRRKIAPKPKASGKRATRVVKQARAQPKPKRGPARRMHPLHFLHPRAFQRHIPTLGLSSTPYVVLRDRVVTTLTRTAPDTNDHVMLIGSWFTTSAEDTMSCLYAVQGTAANIPGTTETYVVPTNITPAVRARARIHRLSVRVTNTGSTGAGAVPDGKFWIGTLRSSVDRGGFPTWNALGTWLKSRPEMVEYSAYHAFQKPVSAVCTPGDFIAYESFKDLSGVTPSTAVAISSAIRPVIFVLGPSTNAQSYDITVDAEWTVDYQSDAVLQSLASTHPGGNDSWFREASAWVANHSSILEDFAGGALAIASNPELAGYAGAAVALRGPARLGGRAGLRALL